MKLFLYGCLCLLLNSLFVRAAFEFEFEIIRHITNGDCFGIDFTIPCETFVSDFCLRDGSFFNSEDRDRENCPLGTNSTRVFTSVPATRIIRSDAFWDGFFQLFIVAHDDDYPAATTDILDYIFISGSLPTNNAFAPTITVFGVYNRVGVEIRYRARCAENFYRGDCDHFCEARDDELGHYTCHANDGTIICNDGYENPETNCVDRIMTACDEAPCARGTCIPIGTEEFNCTCPVGYTGTICDMDINECEPLPCDNGGTCIDLIGGYNCTCPPGWAGVNCEENINECLQAECAGNATCIDGINSYQCVCDPGFEGPLCVESDPCDSSPCAATGACEKVTRFDFICRCSPGFTGSVCEINIDDCPNAVCSENSTCVDGINSYVCECLPGFEPTDGNCTKPVFPMVTDANIGSENVVIGVAVGVLLGIILLLVIIIVIVIILVTNRRGKTKEYVISEATEDNTYEVRPPIIIEESVVLSQSTQPLVNNPMYSTTATAPQPIPEKSMTDCPEFDAEISPAYSTTRDVSNPLYGTESFSEHSKTNGPIYSDPVTLKTSKEPPKGSENYPYSYAMVHGTRRPDASIKVPLPNGNPAAPVEPVEPQKGAEYEEIPARRQRAPILNAGARTESGYEIPKVLMEKKPTAPLVYHYATNNTTPPKLAEAVSTTKSTPQKKSIYDSQDDSDEPLGNYQRPKPVPPPRTNPPQSEAPSSEPPGVYSYATTKGSVKIKPNGTQLPPYDKLEHDVGPDVPSNQVRLAKIEGSGYTALDTN